MKKKRISLLIIFHILLGGCEIDKNDDADSRTYFIGGSINNSNGIVTLLLNKIEEIEITEGDSFTFESNLRTGEDYSVEIVSHPGSQNCEISNNNGEINNSDIENVRIFCRDYYRGLSRASEVAVGENHSCAISEGSIHCWGSNNYGQIDVPEGIINPHNLVATAGSTCVIGDSGVSCWGSDSVRNVPETINSPRTLYSNAQTVCATDEDGVKCWGYTYENASFLDDLEGATEAGVGLYHYCSKDFEGITCWDRYSNDQIELPAGITSDSSLFVGTAQSCALTGSNLTCWYSQDAFRYTDIPETPSELINPSSISIGLFITSCLIDNGKVVCWGEYPGISNPPPSITNATKVSIGSYHACAIDNSGVICWGRTNNYGRLSIPQ